MTDDRERWSGIQPALTRIGSWSGDTRLDWASAWVIAEVSAAVGDSPQIANTFDRLTWYDPSGELLKVATARLDDSGALVELRVTRKFQARELLAQRLRRWMIDDEPN
ncbi:hypothetical protein E2C06_34670 [Dankookia rubra]|uniref:Uncharacterized protein n=1 Tax=Dankookia rubra TaxID=1442381 RepID=A0A4R5Q5Q9_9PROT|nr:hypothetical protein [Dankookia rubra]TDH58046.1 hypothetical protein E2C06_34670 [Dankookia rubra]